MMSMFMWGMILWTKPWFYALNLGIFLYLFALTEPEDLDDEEGY